MRRKVRTAFMFCLVCLLESGLIILAFTYEEDGLLIEILAKFRPLLVSLVLGTAFSQTLGCEILVAWEKYFQIHLWAGFELRLAFLCVC